MEKTDRGILTDEIKKKSMELMGYEINTRELRLMVYTHYCCCNEGYIDQRRVNDEERKILDKWCEKDYIHKQYNLRPSREFYDIMNEIIWLGYVEPVSGKIKQ